ncbi:MAG: neuromedin U [Verrucomicrobiia bacterium]
MNTIKPIFVQVAMLAALALAPVPVARGDMDMDGGAGGTNLQALVTAALNPVSKMVKVPFQNDFNFGVGPNHVTQYTLDIEPIVPFTLNEDWNLITRTIIPITSQPSAGPGLSSMAGLGDINPSIFLSPANGRHQFWGVGPTFTFPTGTSPPLTSGQWTLGPSAVYLATPGPWMIGVVANEQWSVGGWRDRNVSSTYIQPMVIYHLPRGWYLASVPVITADWEADSGNRWTVPVGGGVGKIVKVGRRPLNLQLQAFYNVERPHDGPDWQLRVQILFLFPK